MLRLYHDQMVGPLPRFPCDIEVRIDEYLAMQADRTAAMDPGPQDPVHGLTSLSALRRAP